MALVEKLPPKIVPITLELALRFRDMETPLRGERALQTHRAKWLVKLIEQRKFFTATWGEMTYRGDTFRGNGNHTSHVFVACMQAHGDGLDERSKQFVQDHLLRRGRPWAGQVPEDLPIVKEKQLKAMLESYTGDTEEDKLDFFLRYDNKSSGKSAEDTLGICIGEHDDLWGLGVKRVGHALAGVLRAAKVDPEAFGFIDSDDVKRKGDDRGLALNLDPVRTAVRWIVETVPQQALYWKPPGAQAFAEVWVAHGAEGGGKIVDRLEEMLDAEEDPAAAWEAAMLRKRQSQTPESLLKKGRGVMQYIADEVLAPG